jgi:peptide/nickel transport system permease protein
MYLRYVLKRFSIFVVVVILAVTINFLIPRLMPGDPIETKLAQMSAGGGGQIGDIQKIAEAYRAKFGLDRPIWRQYLDYWGSLFRLDLGYSLANYPERVSHAIVTALPWTIGLLGTSTILSFVIGTLAGAWLAWPQVPRMLRNVVVPILMIVSAIPFFLLGMLLLYFFAIRVKAFPTSGGAPYGTILRFNPSTILGILHHAALPALSIVFAGIGTWAVGMRSMMVDVLGEDYIDLAEAKGLRQPRIFLAYAMRNALLPQVTRFGLALGYVVSGTILVEVVFAYPGVGFKLYQAILTKDYFVMQGIVLLLILSIAVAMLLLDFIYPLIDPRIAYHRG